MVYFPLLLSPSSSIAKFLKTLSCLIINRMGRNQNACSARAVPTGKKPESEHDPRRPGSDFRRKCHSLLSRRSLASDQWTSDAQLRSGQINRFVYYLSVLKKYINIVQRLTGLNVDHHSIYSIRCDPLKR